MAAGWGNSADVSPGEENRVGDRAIPIDACLPRRARGRGHWALLAHRSAGDRQRISRAPGRVLACLGVFLVVVFFVAMPTKLDGPVLVCNSGGSQAPQIALEVGNDCETVDARAGRLVPLSTRAASWEHRGAFCSFIVWYRGNGTVAGGGAIFRVHAGSGVRRKSVCAVNGPIALASNIHNRNCFDQPRRHGQAHECLSKIEMLHIGTVVLLAGWRRGPSVPGSSFPKLSCPC